MIPLYGFLQGDTLGLLILASSDLSLEALAQKLRSAARLRADPGEDLRVWVGGVALAPELTVAEANLSALDCFEVRRAER